MSDIALSPIYPTGTEKPSLLPSASTPRSKRRSSHIPEVLIPDVNEVDEELETSASPRRIFSDEQRKLLYKLAEVDEGRYIIGVCVMLINAAVVLRWPQLYWIIYVIQGCVLIPWRYIRFRVTNEELLLLDFCYWVSILAFVWIVICLLRGYDVINENLFTKHDALIFRAIFSYSNGALAWSVVIFNNRAVFHQVDHMTSTFIHLAPALFTYTLRWGSGYGPGLVKDSWSDSFRVCDAHGGGDYDKADDCIVTQFWCNKQCEATPRDLLGIPALIYVCWAIPYFLCLFVFFRECIEKNEKETLYSFLIQDRGMKKFILIAPENPKLLRPLFYLGLHFILVIILSSTCLLLWNSFYLHTALLLCFGICVIRNASNWVFHYFALRYAESKLQEHAANNLEQSPA